MKVIIEQGLAFFGTANYSATILQFAELVQALSRCNGEPDVIKLMAQATALELFPSFEYGLGANHLWVKQKDNFGKLQEKRLLFVVFNESGEQQ